MPLLKKGVFLSILLFLDPQAGQVFSNALGSISNPDSISIPESIHYKDSTQQKSALFDNNPHYHYSNDSSIQELNEIKPDTLELPMRSVQGNDSMSKEFRKYWKMVEKENGYDKLASQMRSRDIMKSKLPRFYLFDSSIVLFPFPPLILWGNKK
jgi:hypothetical protein